jgi:putative addiction module component (TIGR02574 family)
MSNQFEIVEAEALKLEPEDRAALADRLLASLSGDREIEDAWAMEVERRIAAIEAGTVELIPGSEAIARARDALK